MEMLKSTRTCTSSSSTTLSGGLRDLVHKMPSQIEIANSLRHTDIFQLATHKGQAELLKAKTEGDAGDAVVTIETWQPGQ